MTGQQPLVAEADPLTAAADRWCRRFLIGRGLAEGLVDEPGITIVDIEERAGTGIASAYPLGRHVVIFADAGLRQTLAAFEPAHEVDATAGFSAFAARAGAELLGTGYAPHARRRA